MVITFFVGAIIPVQAILNTRLGKQTPGLLMGSLLSFVTGTVIVALNAIINGTTIFQPANLFHRAMVQLDGWHTWGYIRRVYYVDQPAAGCCPYICTGGKRADICFTIDRSIWLVWLCCKNNNFGKNHWCSFDHCRNYTY